MAQIRQRGLFQIHGLNLVHGQNRCEISVIRRVRNLKSYHDHAQGARYTYFLLILVEGQNLNHEVETTFVNLAHESRSGIDDGVRPMDMHL